MVSFRDLFNAIKRLEIPSGSPLIFHASLSAFGQVPGGAETLLGALLAAHPALMAPVFTYKTMLIPEDGPPNNGITYGSGHDQNRMAEFFTENMPADRLMGVTAELLRCRPNACRSIHPILSFAGVGVDAALETQTIANPLAPIGELAAQNGWVLLAGVDHSVNTSIHYAEKLAKRKQFTRWALTPSGVRECPGWPGCSQGFNAIVPYIAGITHQAQCGPARLQAIPLTGLIEVVVHLITTDLLALLCQKEDCERCNAIRTAVVARPE